MKFSEPNLTDEEYRKLVVDTFGEYAPHIRHTIAVCHDADKVAMVCNYFRYGLDTMFLHYSWYADKYRQKIKKLKYWLAFYDYARSLGYTRIMGVIDTRNIPALIWALKTGWTITGTRQDPTGFLIVDMIKQL